MRYKDLLKRLVEHQKEVTEAIDAIHEGQDLKVVADALFVTLGRTQAIVAKFDSEEQVG